MTLPHRRFRLQARLLLPATILSAVFAHAEPVKLSSPPNVKIHSEHCSGNAFFTLGENPPIALDDAGSKATFKIISGAPSGSSGPLSVLNDGKGPDRDDEPGSNFFFDEGVRSGRITADLGSAINLKTVATYSWHNGPRSSQVYMLYAAQGTEEHFNSEPVNVEPSKAGWTLVGSVDTQAYKPGQTSVIISNEKGQPIGKYRYLLFDIACPSGEAFSNTFFSEIDLVDADAPEPKHLEYQIEKFTSKDGNYTYFLDFTEAPDLARWAKAHLLPVMEEWYPKIARIIPVEGYTPPDTIVFLMRNSTKLPGHVDEVPAFANGNTVTFNTKFMRNEQGGEAVGSGVHEIVHVVQFGSPGWFRGEEEKRAPAWLTEGVADYIRWFLFEPQAKGAEITPDNWATAKYNSSYRITANFYDYVISRYDKELIKHLNEATHAGYEPSFWKRHTGKTDLELEAEWKEYHKNKLGL